MKVSEALLLFLLLIGLACGVVTSQVGSHAVDVWAAQAQQPASATDTILQSRQTPPAAPENRSSALWLGAGLLAIALVLLGSVLFTMRGGSELMRQWRLMQRRSAHRPPPVRYMPEATWSELPSARPVPALPEVDDEQMVDSGN
jgi:hypothetical protein